MLRNARGNMWRAVNAGVPASVREERDRVLDEMGMGASCSAEGGGGVSGWLEERQSGGWDLWRLPPGEMLILVFGERIVSSDNDTRVSAGVGGVKGCVGVG